MKNPLDGLIYAIVKTALVSRELELSHKIIMSCTHTQHAHMRLHQGWQQMRPRLFHSV